MSDFKMSDGREITFDLSGKNLTHKQWTDMIGAVKKAEKEEIIIARCAGLTVDELFDLSEREYRALAKAFINRVIEPIATDPNA
jgi:hypothetical protein